MFDARFLKPLAALLLVVLTFGCAGLAAAAPYLLKIGQNLLGVAEDNYDVQYADEIRVLLTALTDASLAQASAQQEKQDEAETEPSKPKVEPQAAKPEPDPAPVESAPPLGLDVAIMVQRPGEPEPIPVPDGTVVHDGDGDASKADKLKVSFRATESCHLYVIAIDGTGWVTPVFPSAESRVANPVAKGQELRVPDARGRWFAFDEHKGVETLYFLASRAPRKDIEDLMKRFAGKARPEKPSFRRVQTPAVATRGIYATGDGKATSVQTPSGATHEIIPTEFLTEIGSMDLVVTRWLDHQ